MKRPLLAALALAAVALTFALLRPKSAAPEYAVRGLDVSHHNGEIDWPQVAQSGVSFVYVKASEGGDLSDPRFLANVKGAREAGLKVGAYHYFTFCRPGEDQARHFLSLVAPEPGDLPPAVDVEFVGNCRDAPAPPVVRAQLERWLALVEAAQGRRPIIYSTPDAASAFLAGLPHPMWMRVMSREPEGDWTFWQHDSAGAVRGIAGEVDLDVFRGDRAALDSL